MLGWQPTECSTKLIRTACVLFALGSGLLGLGVGCSGDGGGSGIALATDGVEDERSLDVHEGIVASADATLPSTVQALGYQPTLEAGGSVSEGFVVKFDLSEYSGYGTLLGAELTLPPTSGIDGVGRSDLEIRVVAKPWQERGVNALCVHDLNPKNWQNDCAQTWEMTDVGGSRAFLPIGDDGLILEVGDDLSEIDVTSAVSAWLDGTRPNHGFAFLATDPSLEGLSFHSRESGMGPRLRLVFDEASVTGSSGGSSDLGGPVLYEGEVEYDVVVDTLVTNPTASAGPPAGASSSSYGNAGVWAGVEYRMLLAPDMETVRDQLAEVEVVAATLEVPFLNSSQLDDAGQPTFDGDGGYTLAAYRVEEEWGAAASGSCGTDSSPMDQAVNCVSGTSWAIMGDEWENSLPYEPAAAAVSVVPAKPGMMPFDVTSDIQDLLENGGQHAGWVVGRHHGYTVDDFGVITTYTYDRYQSNWDSEMRPPRLRIAYQVTDPTAGGDPPGGGSGGWEPPGPDGMPPSDPGWNDGLPPDPASIAPTDTSTPGDAFSDLSFLWLNDPPVQVLPDPSVMNPDRVGRVHGQVIDVAGSPLSGVRVEILNHPEYGATLSRTDGHFDMAVNGGGNVVAKLWKAGYQPAMRNATLLFNQQLDFGEIALVAPDPEGHPIDLSEAGVFPQVAVGRTESDTRGARRTILYFKPGTTAHLVESDGTEQSQSLEQFTVHVTEYTAGFFGLEAMPLNLPETTAFTFATGLVVEEVVDGGYKGINFKQPGPVPNGEGPVIAYTDNFLDFPVGSGIPAGYADQDSGQWVSGNLTGAVLEVTGFDQAGLPVLNAGPTTSCESGGVDIVGNMSVQEKELIGTLFGTGDTFWRTPLEHFSDWDLNQGRRPKCECSPGTSCSCFPTVSVVNDEPDECTMPVDGSIVECMNAGLGEEIPLPELGVSLAYRSRLARGNWFYTVRTGPVILDAQRPLTLLEDRAFLHIPSKGVFKFGAKLAGPDAGFQISWDGKDEFGRKVQGPVQALVCGELYFPWQYLTIDRSDDGTFGYSGNGAKITNVLVSAGAAAAVARCAPALVGGIDSFALSDRLGGWTLANHHTFVPQANMLVQGDGTVRKGVEQTPAAKKIATTVGNAEVAIGPDGTIFWIGDRQSEAGDACAALPSYKGLWALRPGEECPVDVLDGATGDVGTGWTPPSVHGYLAASPYGEVYFSPHGISLGRTFRLTSASGDWTDTHVEIALGQGVLSDTSQVTGAACGGIQEGDLATSSGARSLLGMAAYPDGSLVVAENHTSDVQRIVNVSTNGEFRPILCGPEYHYSTSTSCDGVRCYEGPSGALPAPAVGEPAIPARQFCPDTTRMPLDVAPDGRIFFGTKPQNGVPRRVYEISPDGTVRAIAGAATAGDCSPNPPQVSSDGEDLVLAGTSSSVPASGACFGDILDVAWDESSQSLLILEAAHAPLPRRLRRLTGDGMLHGTAVFDGSLLDGSPSALPHPGAISVGPDGRVVIADNRGNNPSGNALFELESAVDLSLNGKRLVPSSDGTQFFEFDGAGRHLRTLDALTGAELMSFSYTDGELTLATDRHGNELHISRQYIASKLVSATLRLETVDGGEPGTVTLGFDAYERLSSVNTNLRTSGDPEYQMTYATAGGAGFGKLASFTSPSGGTTEFEWDETTFDLVRDIAPKSPKGTANPGTTTRGAQDLVVTRDTNPQTSGELQAIRSVTHKRVSVEDSSNPGDPPDADFGLDTEYVRTAHSSSEKRSISVLHPDGVDVVTEIEGAGAVRQASHGGSRVVSSLMTPDPRMGYSSPLVSSESVAPGLGTISVSVERDVSPTVFHDPFDYDTITTQATVTSTAGTQVWTSVADRNGLDGSVAITKTSPEGRQATLHLNDKGLPTRQETPGRLDVLYTYDSHDRPKKVTQGSREVEFFYDAQGRLYRVDDPLDRATTVTSWNPDTWAPEGVTAPGTTEMGNELDSTGTSPNYVLVQSVTPPDSSTHLFEFDEQERPYIYEAPHPSGTGAGFETRTVYDLVGRVASIDPPSGREVTFTYGTANNPPSGYTALNGHIGEITWEDPYDDGVAANQSLYFDYSSATSTRAQLMRVTGPDPSSSPELSYTWTGPLPASETTHFTPGPGNVTVSVGRDAYRRVSSMTLDNQSGPDPTINLTYDDDNLLEDLVDGSMTTTLSRSATNGQLDSVQVDNATVHYTHNTYGEITALEYRSDTSTPSHGASKAARLSQCGATCDFLEFLEYDALSRITVRTEKILLSTSPLEHETWEYTYGYDSAGRLASVATVMNGVSQGTQSYTYDDNGNRLTDGVLTTSGSPAVYDAQDRLVSYGTRSYAFDDDGMLATRDPDTTDAFGPQTFKYDPAGNLREVYLPETSQTIEYLVDGRGRRIGRKVNGTATHYWAYGDQLNPIAEYDGTGALRQRFVYAANPHVPAYIVTYLSNGAEDKRYRILSDHLGSVRAVIDLDDSTNVAQRIRYGAWGEVEQDTNAGFQVLGFVGGISDSEVGLVRFGARDYDPTVGRWTSKEPLGFRAASNFYLYSNGLPVDLVDVTGLNPNDPWTKRYGQAVRETWRPMLFGTTTLVGYPISSFAGKAAGELGLATFGDVAALARAVGLRHAFAGGFGAPVVEATCGYAATQVAAFVSFTAGTLVGATVPATLDGVDPYWFQPGWATVPDPNGTGNIDPTEEWVYEAEDWYKDLREEAGKLGGFR